MHPRRTIQAMTAVFVMMSLVFLYSCLGERAPQSPQDISAVVRSAGVDPSTSTLLIVRLEDRREWISGASRTERTFPPASTAKIPHTLIALEEGYARGADTYFTWDGQQRSLEAWNHDQTLSSAYKHSVVWVYQQITRALGHKVMSQWIKQLEYGNSDIGTTNDIASYWLTGPLATSARDQVYFLSKLALETLPISARTLRVGKEIMDEERGDDWVLYGKTGWRSDGKNTDIGWYVGWVEIMKNDQKQTYVFAFNMDVASSSKLPLRRAVVRSALNELGIVPAESSFLGGDSATRLRPAFN